MSENKAVPVALLVPPEHPMRSESLYERLDELKESMAGEGLKQPIGVEATPEGYFEIIWGMRRSLAARELGWSEIKAEVYQPGEIDKEMAKAHENFHRADLNPIEEAEYYRRLQERYTISATEVARRCRRNVNTVLRLLTLLDGDPAVAAAVRDGSLSQAQAVEINLITDDIGRTQGLHYARENGLSARFLQAWRKGRTASGVEASSAQVAAEMAATRPLDYKNMVRCQLHDDWVEMTQCFPRAICEECWGTILDALAAYTAAKAKEDPDAGSWGEYKHLKGVS